MLSSWTISSCVCNNKKITFWWNAGTPLALFLVTKPGDFCQNPAWAKSQHCCEIFKLNQNRRCNISVAIFTLPTLTFVSSGGGDRLQVRRLPSQWPEFKNTFRHMFMCDTAGHFLTRPPDNWWQKRTLLEECWVISSHVCGIKTLCFWQDLGESPALFVVRKHAF